MTPGERIKVLIGLLPVSGSNKFAEAIGVDKGDLSKAVNGKRSAERYFPIILKVFPEVRFRWLYYEEGLPLKKMNDESEILQRIKRIEQMLEKLMKKE